MPVLKSFPNICCRMDFSHGFDTMGLSGWSQGQKVLGIDGLWAIPVPAAF